MAGGGDDDRSVDGVGVHAGLVVVVHSHEGPVGDNTGNLDGGGVGWVTGVAGDEVLNAGCVKELDVRELKDLGKEGGSEQSLQNRH